MTRQQLLQAKLKRLEIRRKHVTLKYNQAVDQRLIMTAREWEHELRCIAFAELEAKEEFSKMKKLT